MIEFTLKKVTMIGFRSFKETQSLILDRKPGLYFITGKNLDQPRLGANGSGKSSLFDAICWCFYGKTIRGLRGSVIKNWTSKDCSVTVEFLKNGIYYAITRTQAPNSLTISPPLMDGESVKEVIVQADIDKFLNLDYEKFLYTLIVGQFNATFLDLQPTEKLNLFSSIMDLLTWEKCSKAADTVAKGFETSATILETQKEGIVARLRALEAEKGRILASRDGFEKGRQVRLKEQQSLADSLRKEGASLEKNEIEYKTKIETGRKELAKFDDDVIRLESNLKELDSDRKKILETKNISVGAKAAMSDEFARWKYLIDTCPYCEQEVKPSLVAEHKKEATKLILSFTKEIAKYDKMLKQLDEQSKFNEDKLKEANDRILATQNKLTKLTQQILEYTASRTVRMEKLQQCTTEISSIQTDKNPYSDLLTSCEKEVQSTQEELRSIDSKLEQNNKDVAGSRFWVKGFKELRMWVISDALSALEIESNNALSELGLLSWKLKFQMERETTNGDISKGFYVLVHPPSFAEDVYIPFETWSGGETQRLKLAGTGGLSSLIKNYKGVDFNISVWDEPSSYLSEEGIEDLIRFLAEEAETSGKVFYFIDQRNLQNPLFNGIISVEKSKEGSIVKENFSYDTIQTT